MEQLEGGAIPKNRRNAKISKNVQFLKKNDFHDANGGICMSTQSEMSKIKRSDHLQQFKRNVEFDADMSDDMVKEHLEVTFPYLRGRRFSCAAVVRIDRDRSKFEHYGNPRVWDSNFIRTKIKGNSTLYLLETLDSERGAVTSLCPGCDVANVNGAISDEQQMLNDSTSGISESDHVVSEDDFASGLQNLDTVYPYDVQINPQRSPQEGGSPCVFKFTPKPSSNVTSVSATFDSIGEISLTKLPNDVEYLGLIPASKEPGWVTITLRAVQGRYKPVLGSTRIYYERPPREEFLEEIVFNLDKQKEFYETFIHRRSGNSGNRESGDSSNGNSGGRNKGDGKQIKGAFESSQPSHVLSILIYAAAKFGAKEFMEIIYNSSAGGLVFNSYKDNATLPESVARDFGNEEIANYLEEIAKRFSQEIQNGKQFSETVDWSELVKATEEAQTKMNQDTHKKHVIRVESGYSADVESSSSASSSASSDQEHSDCDVPSSIDNLECGEDKNEKENVISMGNSGEAFASFTAKSRRTKDGSRGSVVGKIDKDEIEKESVISKGSSGETFTSFTAMSRRTKGSAKGSVVGKIDEADSDVNASWDYFETKYDKSNAIVNQKNRSISFIPEYGKEPNRKQSEEVAQSLYEIGNNFEQRLATNNKHWKLGFVATAAAAATLTGAGGAAAIGVGALAFGVASIVGVFKSLYQEYSRSERPMETDDGKEFTSLPPRRTKARCPPTLPFLQGNQNSRKTNANSWNKGQLEFTIDDLIKIEKFEKVNILKEAIEMDESVSVSGSDP